MIKDASLMLGKRASGGVIADVAAMTSQEDRRVSIEQPPNLGIEHRGRMAEML